MRSIKLAGLAFGVLVVIACGGGGGSVGSGSSVLRQDSFTVSANGSAAKTFGEVGVEVPSQASANGTTLTLGQYATAPFQVPNRNLLAAHSLELASSATVTKSIAITVPDNGQDYLVAYYTGSQFEPLTVTKAGGRLRITLPTAGTSTAPASQGQKTIWQIVVGVVKDNQSDQQLAMVHIGGNDDFGAPNTIVYVHGLFDNALSMKALSDRLSPTLGQTHRYSLAYPYLADTETVADFLATKLEAVKGRGKNITLVGHSRGGIICRYVLGRLGKTAAVKRLVTVNTPSQGSLAATPAGAIKLLTINWLNLLWGGSPVKLTPALPCVAELMPNSPFLAELNQYHGAQRGDVDYILVGSDDDKIVSTRSAQAADHNLYELTSGAIVRDELSGASHSSIKTNTAAIDRLAQIIAQNATGVTVTTNPPEANAVNNGWYYSTTIKNNTSETVIIDDLSFDNYNRSGSWWNVQFFDPATTNGEFFPNFYRVWGRTIPAGSSVTLQLHRWPDYERHWIWEAAPDHQAATARLTARGHTASGVNFNGVAVIRYYYGSIWPQPAQMRRPDAPAVNRFGPMTGYVR